MSTVKGYDCHILSRFSGMFHILFVLALIAHPSYAASDKASATVDAYKELSNTRLEATRDLLQKDTQALAVRIDNQDKRLDDQKSHLDHILNLSGFNSPPLGAKAG